MNTRREIGGYLEFESFTGDVFHRDAIALNCGRACLEYIIELRGIEALWLPDWLCSSVYSVCQKVGIETKIYRIGKNLRPEYGFNMQEGEYLYLVDYYGQLDAFDIDAAAKYCQGKLIVDEAQGFFRQPWKGADTLYTCRKFFGVSDGAYLYTRDGASLNRMLSRDESHARMGFVLGRFERPAGDFFAESKENNSRFADEPVKKMSPLTENIMRAIDYESVERRREANFSFLDARLNHMNLLDIHMGKGPFMYPLMLEDADGIRCRMAAKGVFVPTLWPNVLELDDNVVARNLSSNILPLPIDQRYDEDDMRTLLEVLEWATAYEN